ncbi:MAG TPA: hypothetical protein VM370_12275, partial [Candidatus Thermoplasmatota archaeon]|nr:hypothetical protein [Candidatus Thermoplasmatota archaeon]
LPEIVVRFDDELPIERPGTIEVIVAPLLAPAPVVAVPAAAALIEAPEDDGPVFDDLFEYTKARDEFFDYRPAAATMRHPPEPHREPELAPIDFPPEPVVEDDFVFRPPPQEPERAFAPRNEPEVRDDIIPEEEVRVESPVAREEPWAPPSDFLQEEREEDLPPPVAVEEEEPIYETELLPEEEVRDLAPAQETWSPPVEEEPILEMEIIADDDPIEALSQENVPIPTGTGDLYRLRGFDMNAEIGLAKAKITEIAHLSGHDAGELGQRSGVSSGKLVAWIQVADLVHEVGVPVEAAVALVAAGVAGPRGLRDADPDAVADRATAFGGHAVNARDVRRWKRRA